MWILLPKLNTEIHFHINIIKFETCCSTAKTRFAACLTFKNFPISSEASVIFKASCRISFLMLFKDSTNLFAIKNSFILYCEVTSDILKIPSQIFSTRKVLVFLDQFSNKYFEAFVYRILFTFIIENK